MVRFQTLLLFIWCPFSRQMSISTFLDFITPFTHTLKQRLKRNAEEEEINELNYSKNNIDCIYSRTLPIDSFLRIALGCWLLMTRKNVSKIWLSNQLIDTGKSQLMEKFKNKLKCHSWSWTLSLAFNIRWTTGSDKNLLLEKIRAFDLKIDPSPIWG